jgi:hypothetical protein
VITNRRKLDDFFRRGGQIEDVGLLVGQITGKPKYPKGHVGSKSRQKGRNPTRRIKRAELDRRALVRAASRQLEGLDKETRKATRKQLVAWFKKEQIRYRGLGRKSQARTPVARVAGVIASDKSTGQYHERAMAMRRAVMKFELETIQLALFGQGNIAEAVIRIGKNSKRAIRQAFKATGHSDTGRLFRNIQYEYISKSAKERIQKAEKEARALARANRKARRKR